MWFIGVEEEQETSVPRPKKNPGSAPVTRQLISRETQKLCITVYSTIVLLF